MRANARTAPPTAPSAPNPLHLTLAPPPPRYSYISANSSNYVLGEDWQACTVYADMAIKAYDKSYVADGCPTSPPPPHPPPPPPRRYALYAPIMISALSEQNMVFAILSLVVVYRALYRTEWLLSTVWWLMYVVTGLVCFLGIGPVIPFPTQMHANVLTLTAYVHPDMCVRLPARFRSDVSPDAPPLTPVPNQGTRPWASSRRGCPTASPGCAGW